MIGKLYNYLTTLGSREKDIPCSEGDCIGDDSKSPNNTSHVESESVPKDISEPVISFIKCFEENPRRFKLNLSNNCGSILIDKISNIAYNGFYEYDEFALEGKRTLIQKTLKTPVESGLGSIELTRGELDLIHDTLKGYYQERSQRYKEILAKRKERDKINTRKRLTEIYKR